MMDLTEECFDFNSLEFQDLARDRLKQIDDEVDTIMCLPIEVQSGANLTDTQTEPSPNNREDQSTTIKMSEVQDVTEVEKEDGEAGTIMWVSDPDQISAIIQIVIQGSAGRSEIRLDEISKQIVRKQFKSKKHQFMTHLRCLGYQHLPDWQKTENLLLNFLSEKYGLCKELLSEQQVLIAKSIFYNFTARRNDETLGTGEKQRIAKSRVKFCERGTKQEALLFFKQEIARRVIFPGFYCSLKELTQKEVPESIQRQKKLIDRYLEQIARFQRKM